jgi:hypothetical protein
MKRRNFIRLSAAASAALGLKPGSDISKKNLERKIDEIAESKSTFGSSVMGLKGEPIEQVKIGIIGLGNRGSGHARQIYALSPKAKITAICDIRESKANATKDWLAEKGVNPVVYTGSEDAWKEMVKRDDIDLVIVVTPWQNHTPMCVYAMQHGKHTAVEVPTSISIDECWDLVNTAEETQRNCMMLENVCYGDEELWVLNMVEKGIFGTITHGEAAYIHNLRNLLFSKTGYYDQWRIRQHLSTDGNLYPTHGLGPVAQYMDIQRGDKFDYMVSMSSLEASMTEHSLTVESDNEFYNRSDFAHGDMNSSLIKTAKGRTILVQHDVVTNRPYSRINALGGSKAYHEGYPSRLSVIDKGHGWLKDEDYKEMRKEYKHPIWNKLKDEIAKNGGHGGMDFVQLYRLIDCLNKGWALDMDVYDGVAWSVVLPVSTLSIELGSVPVRFPDFTRGMWKGKRKLGIMSQM